MSFEFNGFSAILNSNMAYENTCVVYKKDKEEEVKATAVAYVETLCKVAAKNDIVRFKNIFKDFNKWFSALNREMQEVADEHLEDWYEKNPESYKMLRYMIETYVEE